MEGELTEETPVVVIETGASCCKAGLSGDKTCSVNFPAQVGRTKHEGSVDYTIGHAPESSISDQDVVQPIECGAVKDWEAVEQLWSHVFRELRVNSQDVGVLCMDKMSTPKADREKTCQIMFEKFNVQGLYIMKQATCVLYSCGRTTGTVVDSGYDLTEVVPIYESTEVPYATQTLQIGGSHLTQYLSELLKEKQTTYAENTGLVNGIKHALCFVASELVSEQMMFDGATKEQYTLPDGTKISLGSESFTVPEAIFQPSLIGLEQLGLPELVTESIRRCDTDRRMDLQENIIMAGSNTMFRGIQERLEEDVMNLSSVRGAVKVIAPPERNKSAWLGGSVVGSLSVMYKNIITKHEYTETGPSVVYNKC